MAWRHCAVCWEPFELTPEGACDQCGTNLRIVLEVRRQDPVDPPGGPTVGVPVGPVVGGAVGDELVGASDSPRCPRCGGEVDPAAWACYPCGWLGWDKYAA